MPKPHIPLDELRAQVAACYRCPLANGHTQTDFGVSDPAARVLIVSEAPGNNEDLKSEPFVGTAEKNLNKLLGIAGLKRGDVFIVKVNKCRLTKQPRPETRKIELSTPFICKKRVPSNRNTSTRRKISPQNKSSGSK